MDIVLLSEQTLRESGERWQGVGSTWSTYGAREAVGRPSLRSSDHVPVLLDPATTP